MECLYRARGMDSLGFYDTSMEEQGHIEWPALVWPDNSGNMYHCSWDNFPGLVFLNACGLQRPMVSALLSAPLAFVTICCVGQET